MFKYILQLLSIILTISLFCFNIYFTKSVNFALNVVILLGLLIVGIFLFGYRKVDRRDFMYKEVLIICFTFMMQSIFYLISSKSGYANNYSSMFKNYVAKKTIFYVFATIGLREIVRYMIVNVKSRKKYQTVIMQTLLVIMCVFVDLSIATKIYSFTSFTLVYEFIAMFLIPSVSKNILLNYLCKDAGYIVSFSYVLIMDLYIYFLPVTPDLNMLLEAVALLVFPYVVYMTYTKFSARRTLEKKKEKKKESKVVNVLSTIIFLILVCLVSREFKYSMIGIGSESMTGTVNKGDAVIYRRYEGNENLKDKVIVFRKNNVMIVHRVIKSYVLEDSMVYQTKGDYNESADNWLVEEEDVIGVVEKRIPLIAWPSVILGEIF